MRKLIAISFAFVLLSISSVYAQNRQLVQEDAKSERRVALVIGNSAYEAAPLKNPVNDAHDIAQALRDIGFDVIHKENINQNDMKRAIRAFGEKIRNSDVALFYYAGHGIQVNGENYLIPVGATIEKEEEVEYEGVDAGFVLAQMENARSRTNIVILDACRNNPFARSFRSASRGLASINAPSGTLIAYATAPGSVASDGNDRNGLYTQELLKNLRISGLDVEEVFKRVRIAVRERSQGKQTPWESSSLVGNFYFTININVNINNDSDKGASVLPTKTLTTYLFQDEFLDNSNLGDGENETASDFITDGKLIVELKKRDVYYSIWMKEIAIDEQKDFSIESQLAFINGDKANFYGFVWGLKDAQNFYFFGVAATGKYTYRKYVKGNWIEITGAKPSQYIKQDNGTNKIAIKKRGSKLELYINDAYVYSSPFEAFTGHIGFHLTNFMKVEIDYIRVKYD